MSLLGTLKVGEGGDTVVRVDVQITHAETEEDDLIVDEGYFLVSIDERPGRVASPRQVAEDAVIGFFMDTEVEYEIVRRG